MQVINTRFSIDSYSVECYNIQVLKVHYNLPYIPRGLSRLSIWKLIKYTVHYNYT